MTDYMDGGKPIVPDPPVQTSELRRPKWEFVRTEAGWHIRLRATNGEIIVSSEVYNDPESASWALRLVVEAATSQNFNTREVDER